ncbi:hypothetical protein RJT34_01987 [Clitoria ternatea]|uniref:Serine-threonine/tyrosine-protein kinase catalytic domain-containing protein n=1 Tax=Clitoria ternatea TaxID=43366 RepID=A0AAN9KGR2_CLITE
MPRTRPQPLSLLSKRHGKLGCGMLCWTRALLVLRVKFSFLARFDFGLHLRLALNFLPRCRVDKSPLFLIGRVEAPYLSLLKHTINEGYLEAFVREGRSLSHDRHQNFVALLGNCENEVESFLVYELCYYGNLSVCLPAALPGLKMFPIIIGDKGSNFLFRLHIDNVQHSESI